jgi:isopenicillin-N epimerase
MSLSRRGFLGVPAVAALGSGLLSGGLLAALEAQAKQTPAPGDWAAMRGLFRLTPEYAHFASFFIVSHPAPVRAAIEQYRDAIDANPFHVVEHGLFMGPEQNLQLAVCREAAAYMGAKPDEIALTPNTTTSLALVYHGLPLKPGDEVLCSEHDHSSHHESIRYACERSGASTRRFRLFASSRDASVEEVVANVRAALRPETRVLGLTWVHSSSGLRLPAAQIGAMLAEVNATRTPDEHIRFVLDGVHGFGAVDEDIPALGCDYFCAGTHKWIFAPRGTGLLWARADGWAHLRPTIPSFSSEEVYVAWIENRAPRGPNTADRVSPGGFLAYEHQWAMASAFRLHRDLGRARVAARIAELNGRIKDGLAKIPKVVQHTPRDAALSAGLCCFEVEGRTPAQIVEALHARKIIASTSPYAVTYARLAAGLMNTEQEIDRALEAVAEIARG